MERVEDELVVAPSIEAEVVVETDNDSDVDFDAGAVGDSVARE